MIREQDYAAILANLSKREPLDLDAAVFGVPERAAPVAVPGSAAPPSSALWQLDDASVSHIGVRVKQPLEDADVLAARLAAIALERRIHPVFLSYTGLCGMQRFGFRVEQLSGLTEAAQEEFEAQLALFWKFAMIIDAADIERLG